MRELVILIQASIEPSIPERYAKTEYKNKFEILGEERKRIRDELRESSMNTDKLLEKEEKPEPQKNMEEENDSSMKDESEEMQEQPMNENKPEEKAAEAKPESSPEPNTTISSDPEVKTEPVTLNFDIDDEEEEKTPESQEQVAESEGGAAEMKSDSSSAAVSEATDASDASEKETAANDDKSYTNGDTYYLIAGSFKNEQNAIDYKDKLAGNNYPAVLLNKPDSDFFFVAYDRFSNLDHAKAALADIVQNENDSAWIYKKQ